MAIDHFTAEPLIRFGGLPPLRFAAQLFFSEDDCSRFDLLDIAAEASM
jgi:hypothetical protein